MKKHIKGFTLGVLCTIIVSTLIISALAQPVDRDIRVSIGGISIYIDGTLRTPTDAAGNVVEPMIYEGTTYLPVRALTNMLTDKAINWDPDTRSIHIGMGPRTPIDELRPTVGNRASTGTHAQFQILGETISPINSWRATSAGTNIATYALHAESRHYSAIQGEFVSSYRNPGASGTATLQIFSVDDRGVESLIQEYSVRPGEPPVTVNASLSGVSILRIRMSGNSDNDNVAVFYNVTLANAN